MVNNQVVIQSSKPLKNSGRNIKWERALCREDSAADRFHGDGEKNKTKARINKEAKEVCNTPCPIILDCREYALENRLEHGVWGGLTNTERRKIWKEQLESMKQPPTKTTAICSSRSRYGKCRLTANHADDHAVPIGDDVWFVYPRGKGQREPLGLAKWDDDQGCWIALDQEGAA